MNVFNGILALHQRGEKQLAVLLDPDKISAGFAGEFAANAESSGVDIILIGGSLLTSDKLTEVISSVKSKTNVPVIIFPGSIMQVSSKADAILFLSLISGRNPEYLIGNHVIVSPILRELNLEPISTGYILIDSGVPTSASFMSNSFPIPRNKPDIAAAHALAADYLGIKQLYLEGGSGAQDPVPNEVIMAVRKVTDLPIWVGGGIRSVEIAKQKADAGASVIVVGTHFEYEKGFAQVESFAKEIKR
ncbi:MAG: geranylgeranylglyceryl/heptaprenylglyceryl phosphate synthase [Bacteroidetes bacterium]|nr:geranylgeranylglyceryl/heptaprenylglyceryl phosphate synthase [Bacteroidota bacterium]